MMKLLTKPISSPSHPDTKFPPPPLIQFLRTNNPSTKPKSKSHSSPIFIHKKPSSAAIEPQEPSSPKVTCMGQIRITKSKPKSKSRSSTKPRFQNFRNSFKIVWGKWVLCFKSGFLRNRKNNKPISKSESESELELESKFGGKSDYSKEFESVSSSPPSNSLILTRCGSAPYRSSSLAYKFWGSPLEQQSEPEQIEIEKSILKNLNQESEINGEMKFFKQIGESVKEISMKSGNDEKLKMPLILRRSKSEPARTAAEKQDPDID